MSSYDFVHHGQQLVDGGQYQEAVKVCRLGLLAHPTALTGRLVLGQALVALHRYDEVLAEMRVALEIDPTNAHALALKGEALLYKGEVAQAAPVLNQAYAYAPGNRRLALLCRQAEDMLAAAGEGDFGAADDSMTRHYPAQPGHHEITSETGQMELVTAPREHLGGAFADDGTLELDPSTDVYELAVPLSRSVPTDRDRDIAPHDDPAELASAADDFINGPGTETTTDGLGLVAPHPAPAAEPGLGPAASLLAQAMDKPTAFYRKMPARDPGQDVGLDADDDLTDEETNAIELPRSAVPGPSGRPDAAARPPLPPSASPPPLPGSPGQAPISAADEDVARRRTVLHAAQQQVPGAPPPAQVPAIEEIFPDRDSDTYGAVTASPPPASPPPASPPPASPPPEPDLDEILEQVRSPNQPALTIAGPPTSRRSADMRVIRAGLGLDPEGTGMVHAPEAPPMPAAVPPAASLPAPSLPAASLPAPSLPAPELMRRPSVAPGVPVPAPSMRTTPVPRRRSPIIYAIYAAVALIVVVGGVFAGFQIREIRLDREIRATQRDAVAHALDDTYDGYFRARAAHAGIVGVRANTRTRSALARIQAAIAFEFGEGYAEARSMVSSLGSAGAEDAVVARAYMALADGDMDVARLRIADLEKAYPDEPTGPYLRGRAALFSHRPEDAITAFEEALAQSQRPMIHVNLARAHMATGAFSAAAEALDRALATSPEHAEAIIARGQLAVATRAASPAGEEPGAALEAVMEQVGKDGGVGPSPRQRAHAALTLAALRLVRGDSDAARAPLARVPDLMPLEDSFFSREYIRVLIAAGELDTAHAEAERAMQAWPEAGLTRVAYAEVALLRDQADEALRVLEGDVQSSVRALIIRGRSHLALENLELAAADLDAALRASPAMTEALVARAAVDLRTGDARAALARLEPIYTADAPGEVGVVYAAALRQNGRLEDARRVLEPLVERPRARGTHLELARLERAEGNYDEARAAYERAMAEAPASVEARFEAALLAVDTGAILKARAALEALAASHPTRAPVAVEAARVLILTGAYEEASALLEQAEKLPDAPRWQIARERGRLALRRSDRAAVTHFNMARTLEDNDAETRLLLLHAQLKEAEDLGPARKTLEDAYKHLDLDSPMRLMARARFDLAEDRIEDALRAYRQARARLVEQRATPREIAEVEYWIGRAHFLADRLRPARKSFQTAVERDPGNADAHFYIGLTSIYLRAWETAENAFLASIEVDAGGNPEAWFYLGQARHSRKRWRDARRAFNEYIKRSPEGHLAAEARTYLGRLR